MLRQTAARGTEREKEGESTKRMKTLAPNGVLEAVGRSRDPRHHVRHNAQMGEEGLGLRHVPGSPLVPRSREILAVPAMIWAACLTVFYGFGCLGGVSGDNEI